MSIGPTGISKQNISNWSEVKHLINFVKKKSTENKIVAVSERFLTQNTYYALVHQKILLN